MERRAQLVAGGLDLIGRVLDRFPRRMDCKTIHLDRKKVGSD
jgi:hypothetical protein